MLASGVFIFVAIWAWKAAKYWQEKFLIIATAAAWLLFGQIIPSLETEAGGLLISLGAAVACIAVMIGLGHMFRSRAMKEVLEEADGT